MPWLIMKYPNYLILLLQEACHRIRYRSDIALPYPYPHPAFRYEYRYGYWRMWKNDIRIHQNQISDTDRILVDRMRILIRYVKIDTVMDKLNGYTYIIFYFIYNNIKCDTYYDIIVYISMFSPYTLSFGFYNNGLHNLLC